MKNIVIFNKYSHFTLKSNITKRKGSKIYS